MCVNKQSLHCGEFEGQTFLLSAKEANFNELINYKFPERLYDVEPTNIPRNSRDKYILSYVLTKQG